MNYKEHIASHLRACLDRGLTQAELARKLGFNNSNVISMHLDPSNVISPFPLKRLPALAKQCRLPASDVVELVRVRTVHHPDRPTELDQPTLEFILSCNAATVLQHAREACHGR